MKQFFFYLFHSLAAAALVGASFIRIHVALTNVFTVYIKITSCSAYFFFFSLHSTFDSYNCVKRCLCRHVSANIHYNMKYYSRLWNVYFFFHIFLRVHFLFLFWLPLKQPSKGFHLNFFTEFDIATETNSSVGVWTTFVTLDFLRS